MTTTPLRTEAQVDRNWVSLQKDTVTLRSSTPEQEHYAYDTVDLLKLDLLPTEPKRWESALKVSGRVHAYLTGIHVAQCKENALDINWSEDITLDGSWGVIGDAGEQCITIKGGSRRVLVRGTVYSYGTRADIAIGLHSDQSFEPTEDINLSELRTSESREITGRPLTVILCRVNQPWKAWLLGSAPKDIQLPAGAKVLRLMSFGAQCHWLAKWVGVKTGLIKGRRV